jgi:CBS domain-containing protein
MKLGDLLSPERIRVPLRARSVAAGFEELAGTLRRKGGEGSTSIASPPSVSPSGQSCLATLRRAEGGGSAPRVALGVAPRPLEPHPDSASGPSDLPHPRILILLDGTGMNAEAQARVQAACFAPAVERALLRSGGAEQILGIRPLTEAGLARPLRVEDVMTPLSYRIYPDTPMDEVLDLVVRRELATVPVVGEGLQVLGMISAGDVLRYGLQSGTGRSRGRADGGSEPASRAEDVMSRSVLCVSDDEPLNDAAQLLANRNADQLPVVRDGEIVGFLTRNAVLTALFAKREPDSKPPESIEGSSE